MPIFINAKNAPKDYINTTSHSTNWSRGLSPFFLGPVPLYGGHISQTVENAWQFSKVYPQHVDANGEPTEEYWRWALAGWRNPRAVRYPMGKGAKPLCSLWDGQKLGYIEARKKIYAPLYANAVQNTEAFRTLEEMYEERGELYLWDFDGFNHHALNMTYADVINCETKTMGHSFILAMLLDGDFAWL